MGLMNGPVFHPQFTREMGRTVNKSMTCRVTLRRSAAVVSPDSPRPAWNYDTGSYGDGSDLSVLATNIPARIETGQDFRARAYIQANQTTVIQQVNLVVPVGLIEWADGLPDNMKTILDEDQFIVESSYFEGLDLALYIYKVRNPLASSTDGWRSILCDVDMKSGVSRGVNP